MVLRYIYNFIFFLIFIIFYIEIDWKNIRKNKALLNPEEIKEGLEGMEDEEEDEE